MRYVTAALVSGGATGHRTKDQWTARIAAHLYNLTYVHYPFPRDTWPVNGRLPDEPQWESFLGFGEGEIQFHQLDLSQLKIVRIDKTEWCGLDLNYVDSIIKAHPEDNVLFFFTESARILLEQLDEGNRNAVMSNLYGKYWNQRKTNPVTSYFNRNHINVAMHVRRGADVAPDGRAPWRATVDSYYHGIIENIRKAIPQHHVDFHIYSEGPASIFESYKHIPDVYFHFCPWPPHNYQHLFTSFHHMITADILVTATSEFSYFCAHMNMYALTITLPVARVCELPNEARHIKSGQDGSFDSDRLQAYFSNKHFRYQPYSLPLHIYNVDLARTFEIDAAMQWANEHNLEPKVIGSTKSKDKKYLQLESPTQRIPNVEALTSFHEQRDFLRVIDREGKVVAICQDGIYDFYLA